MMKFKRLYQGLNEIQKVFLKGRLGVCVENLGVFLGCVFKARVKRVKDIFLIRSEMAIAGWVETSIL